jgi:hypothetical protein
LGLRPDVNGPISPSSAPPRVSVRDRATDPGLVREQDLAAGPGVDPDQDEAQGQAWARVPAPA